MQLPSAAALPAFLYWTIFFTSRKRGRQRCSWQLACSFLFLVLPFHFIKYGRTKTILSRPRTQQAYLIFQDGEKYFQNFSQRICTFHGSKNIFGTLPFI